MISSLMLDKDLEVYFYYVSFLQMNFVGLRAPTFNRRPQKYYKYRLTGQLSMLKGIFMSQRCSTKWLISEVVTELQVMKHSAECL